MAQRLPTPGSDDNAWGDILNGFLGVAHNSDGTIKAGIITTNEINSSAGITKTQLASAVQSSLSLADTSLQTLPSATTTSVGVIQLAGDLGGTATTPSVPGLASKQSTLVSGTNIKTVNGSTLLGSGDLIPASPGDIKLSAASTVPSGWLACNGSAVSRTTYANLYTAIGTTFGTGDGSTTFNLPNLADRVPVGSSGSLGSVGATGGEKTHVLTVSEMPSHSHTQDAHGHGASDSGHGHGISDPGHYHSVNDPGHSHSGSTSSNGDHSHGPTTLDGFMTYQTTNATRQKFTVATGTAPYTIGTRSGQIGDINYGGTTTTGAHTHSFTTNGSGTGIGIYTAATGVGVNTGYASISVQNTTATNQSTGGGGSHNVMQPYVVLSYLIAY